MSDMSYMSDMSDMSDISVMSDMSDIGSALVFLNDTERAYPEGLRWYFLMMLNAPIQARWYFLALVFFILVDSVAS